MRVSVIVLSVAAFHAVAAADIKSDLEQQVEKILNTGGPANDPLPIKPRLIVGKVAAVSPADYTAVVERPADAELFAVSSRPVVATAADGTAAWVAVDVAYREMCAKPSCDHDPDVATGHMTAVFERGKPAWQPIAWITTKALSAKDRKAKGAVPSVLERKVDAGAEDAVKQFEATIGDPAAFAGTVSQRKDVVLFGSEQTERFVGSKAVRAQLSKWKLGFKLRDGIQAGVSSARTVAFIAANVDGARATDKASTPYRMFAIYEKTGTSWQVAALQFSAPAP
jgi:hypothetical protein